MRQSRITRAITSDGGARLIYADTARIVQRAHIIHNTSKTMTAALGRALTAASIMGSLLKDKDNSLTLQFKGDGPAGSIVCVSDYKGNVRGYAANPEAELPPRSDGKLNVGGAVGSGTLYVIKDLGMSEPYIGLCRIVSGEIAEDITEYFAASEQTPSVCALGVRCSKSFDCTSAGGFLLQLLPGADDELIGRLEQNVAKITSISELSAEENAAQIVFATVFDGIPYEVFDEFDIDYTCECSKEKYARALVSLGRGELEELYNSGKSVETKCRFCGTAYSFSTDEINEMLKKAPDTSGNR